MAGKILVVDDEVRYAEMVKDLLVSNGYNAEMETDPQLALDRVLREPFDLVVSDYKMPVMDGSQLLTAIQSQLPDLPVIIISGLMNMPELIKVANIGVTLVLEKPFDTEEFLACVARFVESKEISEGTEIESEEEFIEKSSEAKLVEKSWSFPEPKFLAATSKSFKDPLETLYKNWNVNRHFFISIEDGLERDLLLKELSEWPGELPKSELAAFHLVELEVKSGITTLLEVVETGVEVVLIHLPPKHEDLSSLFEKWWECYLGNQENFSNVSFLYTAEASFKWNFKEVFPSQAVDEAVLKKVIVFPPLNQRIEDVAVYAKKYSKQMGLENNLFSPTAVELLLRLDLNRGLSDLVRFVGLYFRSLTDGERVESKLPAGYELDESKGSLELYLQRVQNLFILSEFDPAEGVERYFKRKNYVSKGADVGLSIQEQKLFYPDLLLEY